jgi:hypothetical protein
MTSRPRRAGQGRAGPPTRTRTRRWQHRLWPRAGHWTWTLDWTLDIDTGLDTDWTLDIDTGLDTDWTLDWTRTGHWTGHGLDTGLDTDWTLDWTRTGHWTGHWTWTLHRHCTQTLRTRLSHRLDRVSRDAFTLHPSPLPPPRSRGRRALAAPSPAHVTVSRGSTESLSGSSSGWTTTRAPRARERRKSPGARACLGQTFHSPLPPCWRAAARLLETGGPAPALLPVVGHHRPKRTACSKCLSHAQTTDSWRSQPVRPHFCIMT